MIVRSIKVTLPRRMWKRICEVHDEHTETLNINHLESKDRGVIAGKGSNARTSRVGSWDFGVF
jgi:hypothetical protein